jgi:hypothetical protein
MFDLCKGYAFNVRRRRFARAYVEPQLSENIMDDRLIRVSLPPAGMAGATNGLLGEHSPNLPRACGGEHHVPLASISAQAGFVSHGLLRLNHEVIFCEA